MKNIIFSAKFTLTRLGVTLVNSRGREHKLPRNFQYQRVALSTEFASFMFYRPVWFAASHSHRHSLKVVLPQTANSWANAGVLLGARMHRERGSFQTNFKLSKVRFMLLSNQ